MLTNFFGRHVSLSVLTLLLFTFILAVCDRNLKFLVADCLDGAHKEIGCKCCTICCEGLPNMRCIDQKTKQEVIVGTQ
jgi:hypothetical protein